MLTDNDSHLFVKAGVNGICLIITTSLILSNNQTILHQISFSPLSCRFMGKNLNPFPLKCLLFF